MRLYGRQELLEIDGCLKDLLETLITLMEENLDTYMPGFTHMQKAQPTTLAHHLGAYFGKCLKETGFGWKDIYARMNYCPLGIRRSGGYHLSAGSQYDGFPCWGSAGPTLNSMDSVSTQRLSDRVLSALSTVMMHLNRFQRR